MKKNKVWFITAASRGFGREWTKAALERGDKVIATVRKHDALNDLLNVYPETLKVEYLDVTDRENCYTVTDRALKAFGRIDVYINNAGYGQFGFVEELNEKEIREQMETNLFGNIWMLQAITPIFRQQKSGHILQISSIGGLMSFPGVSMYHATKFAMEGICDSLYQELKEFGVKITIVEPAGFSTDFGAVSSKSAPAMEVYDQVRENRKKVSGVNPAGLPEGTSSVVLKIVDAENPPLRLLMGINSYERIETEYTNRLDEWKTWYMESREASGLE
jgi:short-subunit dehydrogenase